MSRQLCVPFDVSHYIDDGVIKYDLYAGQSDNPCASGVFRLRDLTRDLINAHCLVGNEEHEIVEADGYTELVALAQDLRDELDYVNSVIEKNKHHMKGHG